MSTADYKTMTTAEIREDFLRFFEEKGCKLYPSSSLVPDDPSLLLTNAGMNQFKEYYQGKRTMPEIGACSCQKCLRTNDIDNIGDATHLSFFEMLGNFSFGGYSKADAIAWAYEFITAPEHLGLPKERLYMTVFEDDDEAIELWHEQGVPYDHISRLGADDNFWAAGPTGPCGPCSEIYFDQGEEFGCGGEHCGPGCDDCDRYLEFWNLVFTQYDRQEDGSMPDLPHKNIDTGMGLERIAAIMQHKSTNYDGDLLQGLIGVGERLSGRTYGDDASADRSLRIVADHARAVTFMIGDGILPGNEGRGYVLRRLLRRAVYHGRLMGIEGAFLGAYVEKICELMGGNYPAVVESRSLIDGIVAAEEERFGATLDAGEALLATELEGLGEGATLPGEVAFKLHDTYGFPIDLTREICEAAGRAVDMDAFDACMTEQRERARASANRDAWGTFNDVWTALDDRLAATEFRGYDDDECAARALAIVADGSEVQRAEKGMEVEVVLDRTPFYAEMGGQVGDTGRITTAAGGRLRVADTKVKGGLYVHVATVEEGSLAAGDEVTAAIDAGRRELIRRNHTATHLLDAALKRVLGDHVSQAGSLVAPDRLRFDFTHFEAVTADELARIEGMVNAEIFAAEPIVTRVMGLEEAKASGAVALFGEKYGDVVRVVSTGDGDAPFSRELCGGTHARNTADLGLFKIVSEGSVGSNARRIEAVTSMGAIEYVDERLLALDDVAHGLKCRPDDVAERVAALQAELRETRRALEAATTGAGASKVSDAFGHAVQLDGYKVVVARLDGLTGKEMRSAWDGIRDAAGGEPVACVIASATPDGKVALLAGGTDGAVEHGFAAGSIIKEVSALVGGRGGGRPNMAQAGGSDVSGIDAALDAARAALGI
ncbi:MAG TPA: alanine--tRNA ligase [Candidatus Olsenella excrementigallinarum]|uniref:alanine--tRNA ligase n=1 Tax=Olsenella timonensis TaxID=1805478 RepID=UPI00094EB0BE|nr:alanine--tRNA ligase [Olsenella timonensis]HJB48653.1 alanine--tRNA ligase [Candidatus Olsenella excrementigallinarum]